MPYPRANSRSFFRNPGLLAVLTLLTGLVITVVPGRMMLENALKQDEVRLESIAHTLLEEIDSRLEKCDLALQRMADVCADHPELPIGSWSSRLDSLELDVEFPEVLEIGYAVFLYRGGTNWLYCHRPYTNWTHRIDLPEENLEHWMPIQLISPQKDFTFHGLGTDLRLYGGSLANQDVIDRAFKSGRIRFSRKLASMSRKGQQEIPAVRFVLPVYPENVGMPRSWVGDGSGLHRLNTIKGAVFGSIDVQRLLQSILKDRPMQVSVSIHDSEIRGAESLLAHWPPGTNEVGTRTGSRLSRLEKRPQYSRSWWTEFHTLPLFESGSSRFHGILFMASGASITLLASAYVYLQTRSNNRLRQVSSELLSANKSMEKLVRDRERLSRDLHDGTMQSIYALGLRIDHCRQLIKTGPGRVLRELENMRDMLNELLGETRQFIGDLQSGTIEARPLHASIRSLCEKMQLPDTVKLELELDPEASPLASPGQCAQLLFIVREALMNSLKHSQARVVRVKLQATQNGLRMVIEDDGHGFDPGRQPHRGNGLDNMAARAREAEAVLKVETSPGSSTRILVEMLGSATFQTENPATLVNEPVQ